MSHCMLLSALPRLRLCFVSLSYESRMSRKQGLPPFIRPEPIIMTSPQGNIHFSYHPFSSSTGHESLGNTQKGNSSWDFKEIGTFVWLIVKSGTYLYLEEIWWNAGTGRPGQIMSLGTTSAQPAVRWLGLRVWVCAHTVYPLVCFSVWLTFQSLWQQRIIDRLKNLMHLDELCT